MTLFLAAWRGTQARHHMPFRGRGSIVNLDIPIAAYNQETLSV